jgi:hypothetical protein
MYDSDSVARSVRRYVYEMAQDPWTISLERDEVRDDDRPAGVVEVGEARLRDGRVSIPQGNVSRFAPVTVTLYPALLEPRKAGRAARQLSSRLDDLITFGADWFDEVTGRPLAGPERIPLYDYDEIDLDSTDPADRAGAEKPHDWLWAEDYSTNAVQDPIDPRRWSVILEVRVSWEQPGRTIPPAPLASDGLGPVSYRGLVQPGPHPSA